MLFRHFAARSPRRTTSVCGIIRRHGLLQAYHWPGNVRELRNVVESMLVLEKGKIHRSGGCPEVPEGPRAAPDDRNLPFRWARAWNRRNGSSSCGRSGYQGEPHGARRALLTEQIQTIRGRATAGRTSATSTRAGPTRPLFARGDGAQADRRSAGAVQGQPPGGGAGAEYQRTDAVPEDQGVRAGVENSDSSGHAALSSAATWLVAACGRSCAAPRWGATPSPGASVPPHLKTVAIPLVDDQSGFGEPGLREDFTRPAHEPVHQRQQPGGRRPEHGRCDPRRGDREQSRTPRRRSSRGTRSAKRRITMSARFAFQDMKLRNKVWEKTFSNWGDYESGGGGPRSGRRGCRKRSVSSTEDVLAGNGVRLVTARRHINSLFHNLRSAHQTIMEEIILFIVHRLAHHPLCLRVARLHHDLLLPEVPARKIRPPATLSTVSRS